jgi:hypothetical protein
MSTTITPTQSLRSPVIRALARGGARQPWVHHGVASERDYRYGDEHSQNGDRASRAERAYAAELAHAEHHARVRAAAQEVIG